MTGNASATDLTPDLRLAPDLQAHVQYARNSIRLFWLRQMMFFGAALCTIFLLQSPIPFFCYLLCLATELHERRLGLSLLTSRARLTKSALASHERLCMWNAFLSGVAIFVFAGTIIVLETGPFHFLSFFYMFAAALYAAMCNQMLPRVVVMRMAVYLFSFTFLSTFALVTAPPWAQMEAAVQMVAVCSGAVFLSWNAWEAIRNETARRKRVKTLAARERRFEDFARTASDLLFETDAQLRIGYCSQDLVLLVRRHGLDIAELPVSQLARILTSGSGPLLDAMRHRDAFRDLSASILNEPGDPAAELHILISGVPVTDTEGMFAGWRCAIRDVTAIAESNARLLEISNQLQQSEKARSIGELTGGMAHTFNNILSVVQGNLELALQTGARADVPLDEMTQQLIAEAHGATIRAGTITRDLMALGGRADLAPSPTSLVAVSCDVVRMLRRSFSASVRIETEFDPRFEETAIVQVDRAMLEHAILNLVLNARDAVEGDGLITLRIFGTFAPGATRPTTLALEVEDTGCGMDSITMARACEPYFTTKTFKRGAGIGLSVVQGFLDQSGGEIEIHSVRGHGTCVRMVLDGLVVDAAVPGDTPPRDLEGGGQTLLLVEDEPQVLRVTRLMLERLGYEVLTAETGTEAWTMLQAGAVVDGVLSDLDMPGGMSGIDLAEALDRDRPELPVMVMSGYDLGDARRTGWSGKRMWLQKPVKFETLGEALQDLLEPTDKTADTELV